MKTNINDISNNGHSGVSRSWRVWAIVSGVKVALLVAFALAIGEGVKTATAWGTVQYQELRGRALELVTVRETVTEIREPNELELAELITKVAAESQVDARILRVLVDKESSGGKKLYRFEPELFERLRTFDRYKGMSTDEVRMLASSHGAFHVLGATALGECKLAWHKLYSPLTSARCAASIVARHLRETKELSGTPGRRLREVFRRFNGSGPRAEAYAADALEKFTDLSFENVVLNK